MTDRVRCAKETVLEIVCAMPEDSTYDEIVQELVFARSDEEMKRTTHSWRANPEAGLAGLVGRLKDSEDIAEALAASRRSRPRPTPKARG